MEIKQRQNIKMANTTAQRLDRIEEKIDKLAEAMIALARAEERISSIAEMQSHQTERLNRLSGKIDDIAGQSAENTRTVQLINKLFWVVIMAAAAAIASNIWM
jgi:methyl-accepting chemotaxis protein|tara:strand:+ start:278 stop:586 length:309 start_codon:yes stop_codon:yes gene_type:complete